MEDQNPGLDGAGEGAEDLELALETTPEKEKESTESSGDPLDDIKDPVARSEAKKHRAIARRGEAKSETAEPKPDPVVPASEFLTKTDFYKSNEKKAVREATADPEVKANWADIIPFYSPRRGKETPEDVLEDIKDAIILFRARNPVTETDDSARELTASPLIKTGGGAGNNAQPKPKDPPNFKLPKQPSEWYPSTKK